MKEMLLTVGTQSGSGRSSQHTVSQTDAGSHLSTMVFPSGVNSAASSSHPTSLAGGDSGPSSRLGRLSYAATNGSESVRTGQLPSAPEETGARHVHDALSRNRAGQVGPDDLAAVSHADGGRRGLLVISGHRVLEPNAVDMVTACSSKHGTNGQKGVAEPCQLHLPEAASMTHAAGGNAAAGASLPNQEQTGHDSELQHHQHAQCGSAAMAQAPKLANADSAKSASGIILSPLSSRGHQGPSLTVSSPDSGAATVSGLIASTLEHPAAAIEQQSQSEGSSVQLPQVPGQTAFPGAETQGQPPAAPGAALALSQTEQRNVEEQEVLYNMTGQTGSLMYMAPEVMSDHCQDCEGLSHAVLEIKALIKKPRSGQLVVKHCHDNANPKP